MPIEPHFFDAFDPAHASRPGEWCKYCNCAMSGDGIEHYDRDTFSDYVTAHGYGEPTPSGYELAEALLRIGDDYATAAAEIVFRGMTKHVE